MSGRIVEAWVFFYVRHGQVCHRYDVMIVVVEVVVRTMLMVIEITEVNVMGMAVVIFNLVE
jgi:hypothetical protein